MKFLFNVNFWGERYTRYFLEISLPSQLAAGNIPYMARNSKCIIKYLIYTTKEDSLSVINSHAFAKLNELVETEIIDFDTFDLYNRHYRGTMSLCHAHAIQYANTYNYSLMFIWPDTIYSYNSFGTLYDLAISGKTSAFVSSLTVQPGSFFAELGCKYAVESGTLSIPPRELVAIAVKNICIQSKQWLWDSPNFHNLAPWIFWDVPGEGLLQRAFHLTPILLTPDDKTVQFNYNHSDELGLDGNHYITKAFHDISSVHVINDSDDFLCVSFNDDNLPIVPNRLRAIDVAMHVRKRFLPHHFSFFSRKIRFHHTKVSPEWDRIEKGSDAVVHDILNMIQLAETFPEIATIYDERSAAIQESLVLTHAVCVELNKYKVKTAEVLNELGVFQIKTAEVLNELGVFQSSAGEKERAIDSYTRAIELLPEFTDAHLNLARMYIQKNDNFRAFRHIRIVIALEPDNCDVIKLAHEIITT